MDNFVTVITFSYPTELAVLRARLESESIEYLVLDELTAQVNPFYSNAIGGIKLQVKEQDRERTIQILEDGGYLNTQEIKSNKFIVKFDESTSKIPFVKKTRLEFRLILFLAIIISILFGSIYIAMLPTTTEKLTKQNWCVDYLIYNGKNYPLHTIEQIRITGVAFCNESIDFRTNGTIVLPGFDSNSIWGKWLIDGNTLYVQQADTFDFVYNGVYNIDFSNQNLILKSKQTTIYCHPEKINVTLPF